MFHNQTTLYFASIRKTTAAFGTLFDSIQIARYPDNAGKGTKIKTITVPLSYGPSEKWLRRISENREITDTRIKHSLPRMSFELTNMQYDPNRKLVTMGKTVRPKSTDVTAFLKQLNPVPYDFNYELNIMTKSIDDGLQIIEQILPNFTPSFNLVVKDIPELDITRDVNVIFNGINQSDEYSGQFEENRVLIWSLNFTVKGYLYPNITDAEVIKKVYGNVYMNSSMTPDNKTEIVTVKVDPIDAAFGDNWSPKVGIYDGETTFDTNGNPI